MPTEQNTQYINKNGHVIGCCCEFCEESRSPEQERPGKLDIRLTQIMQLFGEITIPPDAARFEIDVEFNDGVRVKVEAREK